MKLKFMFCSVSMALMLIVGVNFSMAKHDGPAMQSTGCKTAYLLIKHLAKHFNKTVNTQIQPHPTGNKDAIMKFAGGTTDFAFTCKPSSLLIQKFKIDPAKTEQWDSSPIAKDPIVIFTSKNLGVDNLTMPQLKGIFTGAITNWQEVGGPNMAITVACLSNDIESGVLTVFKEMTIGKKAKIRADARRAESPIILGTLTEGVEGTISFMGMNSFKRFYGDIVKIDGVSPEIENVRDGSYSVAATYYLIYDNRKMNEVAPFLEFVKSADGLKIINETMVAL